MSNQKMIKPIDGFTGVPDADVLSRGNNVQTCMTGNVNFPNPPVDLAALKTALDTFSGLFQALALGLSAKPPPTAPAHELVPFQITFEFLLAPAFVCPFRRHAIPK